MEKRETIYVGKALIMMRRNRGLTQQDLATDADLDRSYLSDLENDKSEPGLSVLFSLAEALDLTPPELVEIIYQQWKRS